MANNNRNWFILIIVILCGCVGDLTNPTMPLLSPIIPTIYSSTRILTWPGVQCIAQRATSPTPVLEPSCKDITKLVSEEKLDEIQILVETGDCDINSMETGITPLMIASKEGFYKIVQYLLLHDANVNLQRNGKFMGYGEVGQTALWYAVANKHTTIVELLLNYQANPNLFPEYGLPILILAVTSNSSPEIAKLLVMSGIDINQTTMNGGTVMTYGEGPSAETFAYLIGIGIDSNGLPKEVIESLKWENSIRPSIDASDNEQTTFLLTVVEKTKSNRAWWDALIALRNYSNETKKYIPRIIDIIDSTRINHQYTKGVLALDLLIANGPSYELTINMPLLLAMLSEDYNKAIQQEIIKLLGLTGPITNEIIDTLIIQLQKTKTRVESADALANIARRYMDQKQAGLNILIRRILTALNNAYDIENDKWVKEEIMESMRRVVCQ
jgi:hypothetical protein